MKNYSIPRLAGIALSFVLLTALTPSHNTHLLEPDWGFFGHKRINRLAALTLPPEMMAFYKPNIDWITDHAVDPDMRRYATKNEAPRHYIDLDNYGTAPFSDLPRLWVDALILHTDVWGVNAAGDTTQLFGNQKFADGKEQAYRKYFARQVLPRYYDGDATLDIDSLSAFLNNNGFQVPPQRSAFFAEHLSEHGILPWNLQRMQRNLTEAFRQRDAGRILRYSADIGHYVGDAHVPLHTTSNYNGQKTGQHGIHGFWESRIPELFADEDYDYFVGKPEYLANTTDFFWKVVLESNSMVDSVLTLERAMHLTFPPDRQTCPDMRNGITVIVPCRDFAEAYQKSLNGMIERRMRASIHAVSSVWYTAWIDAGQPDLSRLDLPTPSEVERKEALELKKAFEAGKIQGRPEEQ